MIKDGWLTSPLFIRVDGVPDKIYTQENTGENGLASHSVVGEEPDFLDGVPNRFLSEEKLPNGNYTANAAASVMFILRKRMPHVQMYPTWASTWTSGGREANCTTWAMEAEGGGYINGVPNFSEPLTEHQIQGFLAIAAAWEWEKKRKLKVGETVWAHWQLAKKFGYASTACESGRYAEAWKRLEGDMADPRVDEILKLLGETEMKEWIAKGNEPVLKTIAKEQKARGEATNSINDHLRNHPGSVEVGFVYNDLTNALAQASKAVEAAARARKS